MRRVAGEHHGTGRIRPEPTIRPPEREGHALTVDDTADSFRVARRDPSFPNNFSLPCGTAGSRRVRADGGDDVAAAVGRFLDVAGGSQRTVKTPFMPAWAWPSTVQR